MNPNWKSKYFEKNINESHNYVFKSLEIEQYLQKILKNQGFTLHDCKLNFNNSILNVSISIYKTEKALLIAEEQKLLETEALSLLKKELTKFLKKKRKKFYKQKNWQNKLPTKIKYHEIFKYYNNWLKKFIESHNQKYLINEINKLKESKKNKSLTKTKQNEILKIYEAYLDKIGLNRTYSTSKTLEFIKFSKNILRNLNLFNNNKFNITLTVQEINSINGNPKSKRILLRLRKFGQTTFYKEGKRLLIPFITQHNSAKLLTHFIATQLRTIKRHNFFFNFLKESLTLGVNQKISKIKGIKLIIKGRLNNAARAKHRIITIGKIPLTTIDSKIDYSESTAFTSNGTLGIKVWTYEKTKN